MSAPCPAWTRACFFAIRPVTVLLAAVESSMVKGATSADSSTLSSPLALATTIPSLTLVRSFAEASLSGLGSPLKDSTMWSS